MILNQINFIKPQLLPNPHSIINIIFHIEIFIILDLPYLLLLLHLLLPLCPLTSSPLAPPPHLLLLNHDPLRHGFVCKICTVGIVLNWGGNYWRGSDTTEVLCLVLFMDILWTGSTCLWIAGLSRGALDTLVATNSVDCRVGSRVQVVLMWSVLVRVVWILRLGWFWRVFSCLGR